VGQVDEGMETMNGNLLEALSCGAVLPVATVLPSQIPRQFGTASGFGTQAIPFLDAASRAASSVWQEQARELYRHDI
jgi:hypothetical protein